LFTLPSDCNLPDYAAVLSNLADLYYTQGKYAQAEPLYQRSLAIREKALGLDHPDVATSLERMALLYGKIGREVQAEALKARAESIRAKRAIKSEG
jgi:tetratricopeptide (TPR) repeat protein